eukprot:2403997-Rhodomonas_salina.1
MATSKRSCVPADVDETGLPIILFSPTYTSPKLSIKEAIQAGFPALGDELICKMERYIKRQLGTHRLKTAMDTYRLTELEAESVLWYTTDIRLLDPHEKEERNVFYEYNRALRKRSPDQIQRWCDFSWFLVNALRKLPPVRAKVYRGVPERVLALSKNYVKDRNVVWISFTSTTLDRDGTMTSFGEGGTFVHIEAVDARDISELSMLPKEQELLLMPNARFRVQNVMNAEDAAKFTEAFGGQLPANVDMILLQQVSNSARLSVIGRGDDNFMQSAGGNRVDGQAGQHTVRQPLRA